MGKKQWLEDGKAVTKQIAIIAPYMKDNVHQVGKYEWANLHLYQVRFEGDSKPANMAFKKEDAPMKGDTIEVVLCIEDEKWYKAYLPEQVEKAKSGGGGGGGRGSDSKHAGWATMYVTHFMQFKSDGKDTRSAKELAIAMTNEVFKSMEV